MYIASPPLSSPLLRTVLSLFLLIGDNLVVERGRGGGGVDGLVCAPCDESTRGGSRCPTAMDCDGGTTTDACGCCLECAKVVNETCGGLFFMSGKCDEGLVCVIAPDEGVPVTGEETGICRAIPSVQSSLSSTTPSPSCNISTCPFSPSSSSSTEYPINPDGPLCPSDSVAVRARGRGGGGGVEGGCCPAPDQVQCQCLPCSSSGGVGGGSGGEEGGVSGLQSSAAPCDPGFVRILKSEGLSTPGQCCDVFECVDYAIFCEHIECEDDLLVPPTCPDDSTLLPTFVTQDGCCFVQQGCECRAKEFCKEVDCPVGLQKRVRKVATGEPGSCCDLFDCVNGSNPVCVYNGTSHGDGETWPLHECTTCDCRGGLTFCEPVQCPPIDRCSWMGIPPGSCCPVCKGCVSQTGELHASGTTWQQDSCVSCRCEAGQEYCQAQMCSIGCINPRDVPGECCPLCDEPALPVWSLHCPALSNCTLMCDDGYDQTDGCYQCSCQDPPPCDLECAYGYVRDVEGFEVCDCLDSFRITSPTTTTTTVEPPIITADYTDPENISSTTPSLPDDFDEEDFEESSLEAVNLNLTRIGSTAIPLVTDAKDITLAAVSIAEGVSVSTERNMEVVHRLTTRVQHVDTTTQPHRANPARGSAMEMACPPMVGCSRQCSYGYKTDKYGCPRCRCYKCPPFACTKKCHMGFMLNAEGCRLCKCLDTSFVDEVTSPSVPWLPPLGGRQCSSLDGQRMDEGQTWWDGCRKCFCHEGHEMCALVACPALRCSNPVMRIGSCCLSCPGEVGAVGPIGTSACHSADGRYFVEGETWLLDECTQCICHQGAALCAIDSCPPVLCHLPIMLPHSCCPICPGMYGLTPASWKDDPQRSCRSPGGTRYSGGDTWQVNDCQSCTCRDGQIHCYSQTCPILACQRTVQKKGQCCPLCIDGHEKSCYYNGEVYAVDENWIIDDCTKCSCKDGGQVLCTILSCVGGAQECSAPPVKQPGVCCPVCSSRGTNRTTDSSAYGYGLTNVTATVPLFANPTVIALSVTVVILAFIIIILFACRWHHASRRRSNATMSAGTKSVIVDILPSKCDYAGGDTPPSYASDFHQRAESSAIDSLLYSDATNPRSTSTASTKLSSSSLTQAASEDDEDVKHASSPSAIFDDRACITHYEDDDDDDDVNVDDNVDDEDDEKIHRSLSETSLSSDVRIEVMSIASGTGDSDVDVARFESSKQLIEKKQRNRRSAGDELEQSARRLLMSNRRSLLQTGSTVANEDQVKSSDANRRSWS